ncbi:MAG: endonuclease/exonuclease/phosphatase family protein [Alphaproteobacteria bacterium]|nr:endonuclease/exonuclease/phosphatase family protein [Alphaproteobacteria bacterium]
MRLATFNLENLDDRPDAAIPLVERLPVLRAALAHLAADVLCLQEVNRQDGPREFAALDRLLDGTSYAAFHRAATTNERGSGPRDVHNLVVLSRYPIRDTRQVLHAYVPPLPWHWLTAPDGVDVRFERPLLHVRIDVGGPRPLDLVNLHLRAPLPVAVPGQKAAPMQWNSVGGWAEGFFLSAMKRTGQALEARLLVERLFDEDADAWVALVGDFNADSREVPIILLRADVEATGNGALDGRSLVALDGFVAPDERFTIRHGGRRLMFDNLLVSRPLADRCRGVEILNQSLADELAASRAGLDAPAGFHAPVVASFAVP